MKQFLNTYKFHFFIIIIGLLWVALFDIVTQMSSQGIIYPDSNSYHESAKNLYVFYRGHNYRPILMAIINGLPYLFGSSDASIFVFSFYVNLFCWLAFLIILFEILKDFVSVKWAFVSTVFTIFFVGNTAYIFHILTENIYMLFIITAIYFLLKFYKEKNFWCLAISLAILVLSMLIKPGSKFLAIVFVLYFMRILFNKYKSKMMFFLYGSFFLVFVQCAGLKYQFGNFTLSYIDAVTYYNYIGTRAINYKSGKEFSQFKNPRAIYIFSFECKDQKTIAKDDLLNQVKYNTFNLMKAYLWDGINNTKSGNICIEDCRNLNNNSYFNFSKQLLFDISKWQNRIFSILGFLLAFYYFFKNYKKEKIFSIISFFILYTILLSGISSGQGDRFHVITLPFAIILIAKLMVDKKLIPPNN